MKLYVIKSDCKGTNLFEIEVVKASEKRFTINDSRISRKVVNKSELYVNLYNTMFGLDKDILIKSWNEIIDGKISKCEREIEKLKDMIIE